MLAWDWLYEWMIKQAAQAGFYMASSPKITVFIYYSEKQIRKVDEKQGKKSVKRWKKMGSFESLYAFVTLRLYNFKDDFWVIPATYKSIGGLKKLIIPNIFIIPDLEITKCGMQIYSAISKNSDAQKMFLRSTIWGELCFDPHMPEGGSAGNTMTRTVEQRYI